MAVGEECHWDLETLHWMSISHFRYSGHFYNILPSEGTCLSIYWKKFASVFYSFWCTKSLIFVLCIIYKYIIFLGIHVNVIIFLISFLDSFLLMYRNTAFLLLFLYHAALLNVLILDSLLEVIEFLAYMNMSSANREDFTSSCQI